MQVSYTELLLIDSPEPPSVVPSPEDSPDVVLDAELVVVPASDVVPEGSFVPVPDVVLEGSLVPVPDVVLEGSLVPISDVVFEGSLVPVSDVVPESTLEEVPEELLLFPLTVPVPDSFSRSVKE